MSAGLSLRTGFSAGYQPMTPPAAMIPTASSNGNTIAQRAYGVQGSGIPDVSPYPAYGSVGVGVLSVAVLIYLWWSLPR